MLLWQFKTPSAIVAVCVVGPRLGCRTVAKDSEAQLRGTAGSNYPVANVLLHPGVVFVTPYVTPVFHDREADDDFSGIDQSLYQFGHIEVLA